jgi:DNA gyrase/topoisomerase IV subunit A
MSANGVVLRTQVASISLMGRSARGVLLFKPEANDSVVSMARISDADLRKVGATGA